MNLLLLAMGLILLGGPHALHMGPGDPNFDEKLVKGKWFSVALASNEPKFIAKDTDMKFFIHKIQVTPESLQFHFHRKVRGMCVPTMMTAHKTKKKFQYTVNHSGHKTIFLEKVDPKHFVIFCAHSMKHGKETVVVTLFRDVQAGHLTLGVKSLRALSWTSMTTGVQRQNQGVALEAGPLP
uniref:Lipocalin/cytosolic fatty-acid binding domain-containing protein n=1 Tax=Equus caballus TaxID=9796 RepID=F7CWT0_HORSE